MSDLKRALSRGLPQAQGLYRPEFEHDACGTGFVANISGFRSHKIIQRALACLCNLIHRGALDADAKSGDGAGVLTQIPYKLFRREIQAAGKQLFHDEDLAVGMIFLPTKDAYIQAHCRHILEETVSKHGLSVLGWRKVPVNAAILGDKAAATAPLIEQIMVTRPDARSMSPDMFERRLFLVRKEVEAMVASQRIEGFYIPSFSSRTLVYKGMFTGTQLERYYLDLTDPDFETALALFHQRYSTNTFPTWALAQPFRTLSHNGEINTIRGNRNWMRAREAEQHSPHWGGYGDILRPVITPGNSDSASLDNAAEFLSLSGRGILNTMMMLVPCAYQSEPELDSDVLGFYRFHECITEPWDGPAALTFSDGRIVGACLDRNGLRPARYKITEDGMILLSSEVGVGQIPDAVVVEKGRLGPGQFIAVDTFSASLLRDHEIKKETASRHPFGAWKSQNLCRMTEWVKNTPPPSQSTPDPQTFRTQAYCLGLNEEEIKMIIQPQLQKGEEPIGSMGDDAPLAVLSNRPRPLHHYFRQLFAQVTNPAMDPIREKLVMSSTVYCGRRPNWLAESPEHVRLLRLESPVLNDTELQAIRSNTQPHLRVAEISTLFKVTENAEDSFSDTLFQVIVQAEKAVREGASLLIFSDRGVNAEHAALPMLAVVGGVHHHLIRKGLRMRASIICDSGECRDVHHFACLIGYGAEAVNPYLIWQLASQLLAEGALPDLSLSSAIENFRKSINQGLFKILSKMGISTIRSYHGAQLFEAIGIGDDLIDHFFEGTPSSVGGIGMKELARETIHRHQQGLEWVAQGKAPEAGWIRYRAKGEAHSITPPVIQSLHQFVGIKGEAKAGNMEDYRKFAQAVESNSPISLRHLLRFKPAQPVPLSEVEPIEEIRRRFTTAGMSLGALSVEAHETLAVAMNRIGGMSNSGEGGEDRERFTPLDNGDSKNSRIKQVASGRFGVTAEYLASASEIEIKIAQGAKPGEGGQLPGHKVSALIARLRHSTPGVMLISPPPHHDIYSIEDLAQLIYDLKQVNPRAKVCVKLVAEAGVGTIAAGVAKAHADVILISGHDGGTGASPLSSIKYAGSPWEIGLAEAQQVLLLNGLRNRVTLRADGGMRTGRDIVLAAILGAEEFNFGTMALIAMGCVYVRQCHLNTCPVGVATQRDDLRAKFKGTAEAVVRYLDAVSQEVREILASIGARSINEIIGHPELLEQISIPDHPKANTLDLRKVLHVPDIAPFTKRYHTWERNDKLEDLCLDSRILQDAKSSLRTGKPIELKYKVRNIHRSIGAQLSGEIAYRYGDDGLNEKTIRLHLEGSAGQSLGCFLVRGVQIRLEGEANDYVGKGMSGGEIIIKPPKTCSFEASENVILGNTVLYGATGGTLFASGRAGERFAVRNSGAVAVVEGIGDHGCEYMTKGTVVVLGSVGKNFGAGMSGGLAFVLDEANRLPATFNKAMVGLSRLESADDQQMLRRLIERHLQATDSAKARHILEHWENYLQMFWKVSPIAAPAIPVVKPPVVLSA